MAMRAIAANVSRSSTAARRAFVPLRSIQTAPKTDSSAPSVTISRLSNGIRVASLNSQGHFVTAGVYVDVGSRNESAETSGCCNLLDRMAFKSTKNLSSADLVKQLENMGGNILAHSLRESIMYQAAIFPHSLPNLMDLYGRIIREPLFLKEELEETKMAALFELREFESRPDSMLPEMLHAVAFQNNPDLDSNGFPKTFITSSGQEPISTNTLGNPPIAYKTALETMTEQKLVEFHRNWYTPERIVIAGIGMDHSVLADLAEKHFGSMQPASAETIAFQTAHSQMPKYTGGTRIINTIDHPLPANPDEVPMTRIQIAFESMSLDDPDVYALATLTSLMGGGGSFSAGGPGKGMYTQLYTQVLNQHRWVEACHMLNYTYNDTGLLSIQATVLPDARVHEVAVTMLADQLVKTTSEVLPTELSRAKNMLKSNLLMSLESRIVELEDIGRQVMSQSRRLSVHEMCRRIDTLESSDLVRVARRVFFGENIQSRLDFNDGHSKPWTRTGPACPTVVVHGPLVGGKNDALLNIDNTLSEWGIGRSPPSWWTPSQPPADGESTIDQWRRHVLYGNLTKPNQPIQRKQAVGGRKWKWF